MQDMADLAAEVMHPLAQLEFQSATKRFVLTGTPLADAFHPAWELLPDGLALPLPVAVMDAALRAVKEKSSEIPPHAGIRIPIGTKGGETFYFELGDQTSSALVGGTTGSGKSVLLHNIILGIIEHYTPQQACLVLMDLKEGIEFAVYEGHPSVQHFLPDADAGKGLAALEEIEAMRGARGVLFREKGVNSIVNYNEAFPDEPMPRVVVVVDEFQRLFDGGFREKDKINLMLANLARLGRSAGIHLVMASQSLSGSAFDKSARNCFSLRVVLRISAAECPNFFDDMTNVAPSHFTRPGQAIYNPLNGVVHANQELRVTEVKLAEVKRRVANSLCSHKKDPR
jgi:hypothetical protein